MSEEKDILLRKKIVDALVRARRIVAEHKSEYRGVYTNSGGGGTTSSNTTNTVPPEVLQEYQQVTAQANQVAAAPLQQYQGQIVANQNPTETAAYNTIDNMQGMASPSAQEIQGFESPYTQQVLNTTMAAENNQDAQQQAQLQGNAISSGAWGGDRSGVAQGILGGQQAIANNATNAGIENQGYNTALNEANTAFNNTLTGAGAQLTAGQLQQQQAQSQLNVPYEQFLQQQAYPFQTTGWLGNIAEGIGSNEGGSSTSSTTQPSQGLFGLSEGGAVEGGIVRAYNKGGYKRGGIVAHRDAGGPLPADNEQMPSPVANNASSGILQHIQSIPQRLRLQQLYQGQQYGTGNQAAIIGGGMARGGIIPQHFDDGGASNVSDYDAIVGNPTNGQQWEQGIKDRVSAGILHQESGNNPNSPDSATGAVGIGQIEPGTFVQYADKGMDIRNPQDNLEVHKRIIDDLANTTGYDPARMAVGYVSGKGNIAPPDSPTPWLHNYDDGTGAGTKVSDYVNNTVGKSMGIQAGPMDLASQNITTGPDGLPVSSGIVPPTPTPPTNAEGHPSSPNYVSELPSDHQPSPWLSVAAGVLGTLAGRSRNPLVDIGQGGLIGLNNYAEQTKVANEQNYQEGNFKQNAQKLTQEAADTKARIGIEHETAAAATSHAATAQQMADTNEDYRLGERMKPVFDKAGNPWQYNPSTDKYEKMSGTLGSGENLYGYKVGTVPEGTSAPVLDSKYDPTINMPAVQKAVYTTKLQTQLEKDNAAAALNQDSIDRLNASKKLTANAITGGLTNIWGIGPIATAFSTQRQEIEALNKELALSPGEKPPGLKLTQGEIMMLKQAQPGTDKSDEANANIADAAVAIRRRPAEFAQFKNDFVANNGYWNDAVGQQMFNQYIKDSPIFDPKAIADPSSSQRKIFALNPNRMSMEQYANSGKFAKYGVAGNPANTGTPAASASQPAAPSQPVAAAPKVVHFNDLPQ